MATTKKPAKRAASKPSPRPRKAAAPATPAETAPTIVAPPPPPAPRRAVFIDVENTSSEADLNRVLDELAIQDLGGSTELFAIGNWRVVGQGLARGLAARGAQLVHSAPAVRVSDWSDLWIAVHAGMWLGKARPGDVIEIVSHDRAFDAVGDAATRLGVTFRRITYRSTGGAPVRDAAVSETGGDARSRRGGRGRRRGPPPPAPRNNPPAPAPRPIAARPPAGSGNAADAPSRDGEPHSASQEQILALVSRLTSADPHAGVNLDRLAVALKGAGFERPPGSPRLVTRLRRMKDLEVLPSGRVRLASASAGGGSHPVEAVSSGEAPVAEDNLAPDVQPDAQAAPGSPAGNGPARRSRRRGGRGRRRGPPRDPAAPPAPEPEPSEPS